MTDFENIYSEIKFNDDGLVPAIAQSTEGEVLMMAWMNKEAIEETLTTHRVCYYSRSRGKLWRKGESSGQIQTLVSLIIDCDGDTLLAKVKQEGVACHTGRRSCFYKQIDDDKIQINQEVEVAPESLYGENKDGK